ncbi:MAG: FecR domain-containing protein, partial [Anaerolineae bacterium]|nr:FecR domain-containing protein [Anaerolineae bacterium]
MRKNPERVAWIVLILSFVIFCLLLVATPLGIRWFIWNAETDRKALVESLAGTVVVEPPVGSGAIPLGRGQSWVAPEQSVIRVDESSEAGITFFDHSFMRLFPGTTVRLVELSSPRYRAGKLPNTIRLALIGGRVRIGTALSLDSPLAFSVETFHAQVRLDADGSYALDASNEGADIAVYRGHATV